MPRALVPSLIYPSWWSLRDEILQRQIEGSGLGRRYVVCKIWKLARDHFLAEMGEVGRVAGG